MLHLVPLPCSAHRQWDGPPQAAHPPAGAAPSQTPAPSTAPLSLLSHMPPVPLCSALPPDNGTVLPMLKLQLPDGSSLPSQAVLHLQHHKQKPKGTAGRVSAHTAVQHGGCPAGAFTQAGLKQVGRCTWRGHWAPSVLGGRFGTRNPNQPASLQQHSQSAAGGCTCDKLWDLNRGGMSTAGPWLALAATTHSTQLARGFIRG